MQLERATSANNEAKLAGWISSNDAILCVLIIFVIVALFMHGKMTRGQSENAQLSSTNVSLTDNLDDTTNQRNALTDVLRRRNQELALAHKQLRQGEEERDLVHQQMLTALERIANLDQTIAAITTEKSGLQTEKTQLLTRAADLEQAKSQLAGRVTTLATEKSDLAAEKSSLNERLTALATQLEGRLTALADLEAEQIHLTGQADKLAAIVATLEAKLVESGEEIVAIAATSKSTETENQTRITTLKKVANDEATRAEEYLAKLQQATDLFQGVQAINATLKQNLDTAELEHQHQLNLKTTVSRKLIGINGEFKRVAVLFDASASMKKKDSNEAGDRWQDAQNIARTWLGHLDVEECVLIVFSSDVRTFPDDGTTANIQGPDGEANRNRLLEQLESVEPGGWTNTLAAFEKAYEYEGVDTILLFSDGAPTAPESGQFEASVATQIYELCRQHPDVPINTIGLGNYFDEDLSTFLRTVARVSGGTFRGR